ncbi:MAG TPA: lipoprotein insertase outer membrane protein LolB [Pseudomonadales bacterium]|nr:lipoprotein insertase outer membrane protein LolB [Pseudomonadales bacterium]
MQKLYRQLTTLAALLWLSACTHLQPTSVIGTPDHALQARLAAIHSWNVEGKLAVRTAQSSDSARLQWKQDDTAFDIHLSGPAGLKATHIYGMPGGVVFEQGGKTEQAGSAETLSEKLIGWPLPTTELTSWLLGLPAGNSQIKYISYTPDGLLSQLTQGKWQIHFSDYQPARDVMLPGKIEAERGDTRITLVIKQWKRP